MDFADGRTQNQIDHITISRKWRHSFMDTRARREADASDHHIVLGTLKIKKFTHSHATHGISHAKR